MLAAVTKPKTEAEIGAVGTGEQPAIAGKTSTVLVVPQRNDGKRDIGIDVAANCEAPQHAQGIDETGRARRDAGRPVRTDHEVGLDRFTAVQRDPTIFDRGDPSGYVDSARVQCGTAQQRVEPGARHDDCMTGICSARPCRQHHPPSARTRHDHVARCLRTRNAETEVVEQTDATRPDEIATRLVATYAGLVDQTNASSGRSEHERGNAASRTSPDDDHVVTCFRQ
jgi:hypothetical protein